MEQTSEIPIYVQLISGTILGVALANLLSGAAKFIQQPKTHQFNILHGLWIFFVLGSIMVFWWQEGLNFANVQWTYPLYMFQVAYCATYLFMTAILLPDGVQGYENHYDYLIGRRHWFYGSLVLSYVLGIGNELVKEGWDDIFVDPTYIGLNVVVLALLVSGMVFSRRWLHLSLAIIFALLTLGSMLIE
nr:hypothetical protein [uncultured Devosia sp.]